MAAAEEFREKMSTKTYAGKFSAFRPSGVEKQHTIDSSPWRLGLRVDVGDEINARLFYAGQSPQPWKSASYGLQSSADWLPTLPTGNRYGTFLSGKEEFRLTFRNSRSVDPLRIVYVTIVEHYEVVEEQEEEERVVDFGSASALTDVVLIVEAKKIHANKNFLAMHSKYFETLFFGEFAEKGASEIKLKDIEYDKFIEFLRAIHPMRKLVTRANAKAVLHMANFFDSRSARLEVERFLDSDQSGYSDLKKLVLADRYLLSNMEDRLLEKLKTQEEVLAAMKYGYNKLSERLKARLVEKIGPLL